MKPEVKRSNANETFAERKLAKRLDKMKKELGLEEGKSVFDVEDEVDWND